MSPNDKPPIPATGNLIRGHVTVMVLSMDPRNPGTFAKEQLIIPRQDWMETVGGVGADAWTRKIRESINNMFIVTEE